MKWFKHDSDANRDPKLEKVLMRYGAEGYALYWLCLELIAAPIDKQKITFELEHDAEILAHRLRIDSARVEEIMEYMIGLDLFEISATSTRITCLKLASRLENSIVKNPNLKQVQRLIKPDAVPDNPGQSRITSDNSGIVRLDIDIDIDTDKKKIGERETRPPRKQQLPADFTLTLDRISVLAEVHPTADAFAEFAQFTDHHRSHASVMADWDAAWRTWCRNSKRFSRGANGSHSESRPQSAVDRVRAAAAQRAAHGNY